MIIGFALISSSVNNYDPSSIIGWLLIFAGVLGLIYAFIVSMVFVYKMWEAIQDGHARTTPGKAVGFLFIPFYNFYWFFQAFYGFAQDFNKHIKLRNLDIKPLSESLFLAYPILLLVSIIPFIGLLASLAAIVVFIYMVAEACKGVNKLQAAVTDN